MSGAQTFAGSVEPFVTVQPVRSLDGPRGDLSFAEALPLVTVGVGPDGASERVEPGTGPATGPIRFGKLRRKQRLAEMWACAFCRKEWPKAEQATSCAECGGARGGSASAERKAAELASI